METTSIKRFVEAKAPVNIAVIKYWGKGDEKLKIPINDSISGTLSIDDMSTTTSVYLSDDFEHDELTINGQKQDLSSEKSPVNAMLQDFRALSRQNGSDKKIFESKVHIVSDNNFPTAAGLASSAAGYACLSFTLGHTYGITDITSLSKIARKGSGSACRSLFGGFVHWVKGDNHESSMAQPIVDENHWPSMKVIIIVANDKQKDVASSKGMARSVQTSPLIKFRAENIVPTRIKAIKKAILERDFESFANITMQDSNQFHAICLDTFPPIFYLNETSKQIIKICSTINDFYGQNKVAYTFDAGPNACIYLLEDFVPEFIAIIRHFFSSTPSLLIKGRGVTEIEINQSLKEQLISKVNAIPEGVKYIINTSIGEGPRLVKIEKNGD